MYSAGNTAAIALAVRRRRFIRMFEEAGAMSPNTAIAVDVNDMKPRFMFKRMVAQGIFVEAAAGRFYLDEAREAEMRKERQKTVAGFVIVVAVLILIAYLFSSKIAF
ncbi:MAG: hypothetical protein K0S09_2642 [Sphingobacteriaceae bacterium]|jgi:hypothetical protein|nr:hypothetical protein [Sphingobacteriaceae bacterium]